MTKTTDDNVSKTFGSRIRRYLIAGILVSAPLAITLTLIITFVTFIDKFFNRIVPAEYNPNYYLEFSVPGLGLVLFVLFLILIGMLATNFLGQFFINLSEYLLDRTPIIRSLYGAIKQILETVLASQSTAFREVVMLEYPRKGVWSIGFVTGTSKGEVQELTAKETVNVFVPTTPNPTSGYLLFVPKDELHYLNMTVEEGIKLVVSAGIVSPEKLLEKKRAHDKKS